jgi:Rrf2 family protein
MRMSEGVEWTVHCCAVLAMVPEGRCLPAARLAEFHAVPGPYLGKHLQALVRAGILESVPGPRGGYRLARPAADISMLEVVEAVEGPEPAFTCTEIRRRGPAGGFPASHYPKPCGVHAAMDRADAAWRRELASVSVAELMQAAAASATPEMAIKGIEWFQEVLR